MAARLNKSKNRSRVQGILNYGFEVVVLNITITITMIGEGKSGIRQTYCWRLKNCSCRRFFFGNITHFLLLLQYISTQHSAMNSNILKSKI